ncbi:hypothetical protein [Amycolatopsis sp. NPDC059657]|uniref:hypothetical protein n=1 Tax=Amycolatopsis sp. NPDC059657 TaxID=3346899 RepID=UPI00366D63BE
MTKEELLIRELTKGDQVWVSLRDSGLPRDQVDVVANRRDREVIWQCTDETDQWMLIAEPGTLPVRASTPLLPFNVMAALQSLAFVLAVGAGVYLLNAHDTTAIVWGLVGIGLAVNLALMPRRAAMPTRIARLAQEFNGKPVVKIALNHYWLSPFLIGQMAATYGYRYTGYAPNTLSATLVFAKMP